MTSPTNIIAKIEAAFEALETTNERPTDLYVTQTYDAIAKIFIHPLQQCWGQEQPDRDD